MCVLSCVHLRREEERIEMVRKRGGTIKPRKPIKGKTIKAKSPIRTKRTTPAEKPTVAKRKAGVTFTVKPAPKPRVPKAPSASFTAFTAGQSAFYLAEYKKTGTTTGFYRAITDHIKRLAAGKWKATSLGSGLALFAFADLADFMAAAKAAKVTPKMGNAPNGARGVFAKLV